MAERTSTHSYKSHATRQPSLSHMLNLTHNKHSNRQHPISMTHHDINTGTAKPASERKP